MSWRDPIAKLQELRIRRYHRGYRIDVEIVFDRKTM
jgi:hypothetical protein